MNSNSRKQVIDIENMLVKYIEEKKISGEIDASKLGLEFKSNRLIINNYISNLKTAVNNFSDERVDKLFEAILESYGGDEKI